MIAVLHELLHNNGDKTYEELGYVPVALKDREFCPSWNANCREFTKSGITVQACGTRWLSNQNLQTIANVSICCAYYSHKAVNMLRINYPTIELYCPDVDITPFLRDDVCKVKKIHVIQAGNSLTYILDEVVQGRLPRITEASLLPLDDNFNSTLRVLRSPHVGIRHLWLHQRLNNGRLSSAFLDALVDPICKITHVAGTMFASDFGARELVLTAALIHLRKQRALLLVVVSARSRVGHMSALQQFPRELARSLADILM
jgi:hypothetical protein